MKIKDYSIVETEQIDSLIDLRQLCYYDVRNPNTIVSLEDLSQEELDYVQVEGEDFANKDCSCVNCFYGRTKLMSNILKIKSKLKPLIPIVENAFNNAQNKGAFHMKRQFKTGELTFAKAEDYINNTIIE
jgi:accessory colonization factor AcfC